MTEAAKKYKDEEFDYLTYVSMQEKMYSAINSADRQIQAKRKMMLDIEKENIMTIASSLRVVPKNPQKNEKPSSMAEFMKQRNGGGGGS